MSQLPQGRTVLIRGVDAHGGEAPVRRVREEVKDGVALVVASAAASTAIAVITTVLTSLVG